MAETTGCIRTGWTAAAAADGAGGGRIGLGIRHTMAAVGDSSVGTVAGDKMAAAGDNPARPSKADNKTSLKLLGGV